MDRRKVISFKLSQIPVIEVYVKGMLKKKIIGVTRFF